jgi:hypothetical protein
MKIVLDLTRLIAEGKLTPAQAEELQRLAKADTSFLAINILMTLGVFAIAAGVLALLPTTATAIVLGAALAIAGVAVSLTVGPLWSLLGTAMTIAGGLTAAGGIIGQSDPHWIGFAISAALLMGLAIAIRSALLSALTVFALAGLLGSSTGYDFATYFLEVNEPTVTIAVFALLALTAYLIGKRVPADYERVALSFARISLVMANFGFWIGSLWGDNPGHSWRGAGWEQPVIPDYVFVIGWAVAMIGVGVWAAAQSPVRGQHRGDFWRDPFLYAMVRAPRRRTADDLACRGHRCRDRNRALALQHDAAPGRGDRRVDSGPPGAAFELPVLEKMVAGLKAGGGDIRVLAQIPAAVETGRQLVARRPATQRQPRRLFQNPQCRGRGLSEIDRLAPRKDKIATAQPHIFLVIFEVLVGRFGIRRGATVHLVECPFAEHHDQPRPR